MPELVTNYQWLLQLAREHHNTSAIRILKRMAREGDMATRMRHLFLVRYELRRSENGLTVSELPRKTRISDKTMPELLDYLQENGFVTKTRRKQDSIHIFERSFVIYQLTDKGKEGIDLPTNHVLTSDENKEQFERIAFKVRDKYGHQRKARSIEEIIPPLLRVDF